MVCRQLNQVQPLEDMCHLNQSHVHYCVPILSIMVFFKESHRVFGYLIVYMLTSIHTPKDYAQYCTL